MMFLEVPVCGSNSYLVETSRITPVSSRSSRNSLYIVGSEVSSAWLDPANVILATGIYLSPLCKADLGRSHLVVGYLTVSMEDTSFVQGAVSGTATTC